MKNFYALIYVIFLLLMSTKALSQVEIIPYTIIQGNSFFSCTDNIPFINVHTGIKITLPVVFMSAQTIIIVKGEVKFRSTRLKISGGLGNEQEYKYKGIYPPTNPKWVIYQSPKFNLAIPIKQKDGVWVWQGVAGEPGSANAIQICKKQTKSIADQNINDWNINDWTLKDLGDISELGSINDLGDISELGSINDLGNLSTF